MLRKSAFFSVFSHPCHKKPHFCHAIPCLGKCGFLFFSFFPCHENRGILLFRTVARFLSPCIEKERKEGQKSRRCGNALAPPKRESMRTSCCFSVGNFRFADRILAVPACLCDTVPAFVFPGLSSVCVSTDLTDRSLPFYRKRGFFLSVNLFFRAE